MVLLNAASRARNVGQTKNQCQGGGPKKPGLIPRENKPAAVALQHKAHYKSLPQSMVMMPHQRNVTNGLGVGRKAQGIRFTAWNVNGTSARVCSINAAAVAANPA